MNSARTTLKTWTLGIVAVIVTLAGGYVHGKLSNRWGEPEEVARAVALLQNVPQQIGSWEAVETHELSANEKSILRNHGYVGRTYRHRDTGATIQCSLLLGPPGPTSVHTPEVCLGSKTFCLDAQRSAMAVSGREDQFWTVTFHSTDVSARHVRAAYGWRYIGPWEAAEQPRVRFGTRPYLYKMQILSEGDAAATKAACAAFLHDCLPAIEDCLR